MYRFSCHVLCAGRTIYEWEQSLDEVLVYIDVPEGVRASQLRCDITSHQLTVGIKGNPPFLSVRVSFCGTPVRTDPRGTGYVRLGKYPHAQEELAGKILSDESMWFIGAWLPGE